MPKHVAALSKDQLQVLYTIAHAAAHDSDSTETLMDGLDALHRITGFSNAILQIRLDEARRNFSRLSTEECARFAPALEQVYREKRPFTQAGFSKQKLVPLTLGQTLYALPVQLNGRVIGSLCATRSAVANRDELSEDFAFLESTTELIAGTVVDKIMRESSISELTQENAELRHTLRLLEQAGKSDDIIGSSPAIKQVFREIAQVSPSDMTVLVSGETGTGKELVARAIHDKSARTTAPFIALNCAALPETLLESELFGHVKGAFTGAATARSGSFLDADGGTLFLDEIGEMSLSAQARLLRVIQEREITPIGSGTARKVDVRLLCATNRELEELVAQGRFREDLFYRINVFAIHLPPLRDRTGDVAIISQHILQQEALRQGLPLPSLASDATAVLDAYPWPGNIRELRNTLERALLVSMGTAITAAHLPSRITAAPAGSKRTNSASLEDRVNQFERQCIEEALRLADGNQRIAAEQLLSTKRIIQYKIQKLEIDYHAFKKR